MIHGDRNDLDEVMTAIPSESGAALSSYPRPGIAVRQIVLRDLENDRGTQLEIAQVETDGTRRIVGKDTGLQVTEHFGAGITCYEWVYIVPPEKIASLRRALAIQEGSDVLTAFAAYYDERSGRIYDLLRSTDVDADFANWHTTSG